METFAAGVAAGAGAAGAEAAAGADFRAGTPRAEAELASKELETGSIELMLIGNSLATYL